MENKRLSTLGGLAAVTACLFLISLAFIRFPGGQEYPGLAILSGDLALLAEDLQAYLDSMRLLFILDGLFLLAWVLAWIGLFDYLREHSTTGAALSLGFGLAGAVFDLSENSLILGWMTAWETGAVVPPVWPLVWQAVRHLSYWLPFLGAAVACLVLLVSHSRDRLAAALGLLSIPAAVCGLYLPQVNLLANLWFLFWFGLIGLLLLRRPILQKQSK